MKKIYSNKISDDKFIILSILLIMSEIINPDIFLIIISVYLIISVIKVGVIKQAIEINIYLLVVLILSFIVGLINIPINKYDLRDFIRDFFRFLTPIIFISYGVYLKFYKKVNINIIYKSIIITAIFIEFRHLLIILLNINNIINGFSIRGLGGNGSYITSIAIIILLFSNYESLGGLIKTKFNKNLILSFLVILFICYLSRTHFVIVFIGIFINIFIKRKLNIKKISHIIIYLIIISCVGITIVPKKGLNQFMEKFSNSITEVISNSSDWNEVSINNNWRGYEVYRAKLLFKESNVFQILLGFGFGKRVDLNTEIYLGDKLFTNIPILHNGYYYILIKGGLIGLSFYILFILYIIFKYYKKVLNNEFEYNLLCTIGISIAFSTYVVTGIYNRGSIFIFCVIIGYSTCSRTYKLAK